MNANSYNDMVTRVTRSISMSCDLVNYIHNHILSKIEDRDQKSLIIGLCTKASKLGYKIDYLLLNAGLGKAEASPRKLEKLYNLTDEHWEAIQELYKAVGQDEYDQQMMNAEDYIHSDAWCESAKELLEPFYTTVSGSLSG